jgi:hypothetical protein
MLVVLYMQLPDATVRHGDSRRSSTALVPSSRFYEAVAKEHRWPSLAPLALEDLPVAWSRPARLSLVEERSQRVSLGQNMSWSAVVCCDEITIT